MCEYLSHFCGVLSLHATNVGVLFVTRRLCFYTAKFVFVYYAQIDESMKLNTVIWNDRNTV